MTLKRDIDDQYHEWHIKIITRQIRAGDLETFITQKEEFDRRIEITRRRLASAVIPASESEKHKQEIKLLIAELEKLKTRLGVELGIFHDGYRIMMIREALDNSVNEAKQGLTRQRIQQFEQFTADESHVDDQCVICMGDIEAGRNMMRLNCDGQHTFCQVCIEGWFADHNTCPLCRHKFK